MMFVWPLKTTVVAQAVPIVTRVGLSVFVFLVLRSTLFIACRTMSLLLVGTMWLTRLSCMFGLFGEMLNFSFSLLWKTVFSFLLNQVGRITFRNWNQKYIISFLNCPISIKFGAFLVWRVLILNIKFRQNWTIFGPYFCQGALPGRRPVLKFWHFFHLAKIFTC